MPVEPSFPDDLELVQRVRAGDPQARELFLQRARHIARILRLKNGRLSRPFPAVDLADLAQETFVLVWGRLDTYSGTGSLEGWFYRFCCNVLGNALQRRSSAERRRARLDPWELAPGAAEDDEADFLATELLLDAIRELEEPYEVVLRLKLVEGLTFEDLGERLGISSNTAKTRYYRAVERIRTRLARGEGAS